MSRTSARARPERERVLRPARKLCPACGGSMRVRYENRRTLVTLSGAVRLRLKIRRCERQGCARHHRPYRPEAEGAIALPRHEFGLDVIALGGCCATATIAACRRSTPSCASAGWRSPSAVSPTCWTATTNCWPCR